MRLGAQPFWLVKMSFICMRMKNDFLIKGWAPTLVLKLRLGGTRKWPIKFSSREWHKPILETLLQIKYSRTSRNQPPKMQRLSGRLIREGGRLHESNHRGPHPRRGPGKSTLCKIIYCMHCLSYAMCTSILSLKFFVYSKYHSSHSEQKDQRMRHVVAYKKLKRIDNH